MIQQKHRPEHITILGGGPAGLTAGYYAEKNRLPFAIYEANTRVGGNSITLRRGRFLFDSGAHLIQTKDMEVRKELTKLLQNDLTKIPLPIQTYHNGTLLDFPFSPLNLLRNVGLRKFAKACFEIAEESLKETRLEESFENLVYDKYGRTIGKELLLNYSEKLWGSPCDRLSPHIAGKLLTGLSFKMFLIGVLGRAAKVEYLGGPACYPKTGFGMIAEKLSESCGRSRIFTSSRISRVLHNHRRIQAVEINGDSRISTDEVVSTLPLNTLLELMEPAPPADILALAKGLTFRGLVLVTIFLDRDSVTQSASVHFTDPDFRVTRIHEPKNRSKYLAPRGETSIVAEIPCQQGDSVWNLEDEKLVLMVRSGLTRTGFIEDREVFDGVVHRLNHAYPVLDIGYDRKIGKICAFLQGFSNLKVAGRNGTFTYLSFHHIVRACRRIIDEYVSD